MFPNLGIFILSQNIAITRIQAQWLLMWQYFFQIPAQKCPAKAYLDNSYLKFLQKKYPNKEFLVRSFRHFYFSRNFAIRQISRALCSNAAILISNSVQKYLYKAFLVPNSRILIFAQNLAIKTKFEDANFKYDNSVFKFQSKYTQIRHVWPKFKEFYFCSKLYNNANSRALIKK